MDKISSIIYEEKSNTNKFLALIVGSLLVSLTLAAAYVYTTEKPIYVSLPTIGSTSIENNTYSGSHIQFDHPSDWTPVRRTPGLGAAVEVVDLGIPRVISDQVMGFYLLPLSSVKPTDVVYEEQVTIAGKEGFKWIRKGEGYTAYDYYIEGMDESSVFGIHVSVPEESAELESKLDSLVRTIEFK